jgi:hypothetical protein
MIVTLPAAERPASPMGFDHKTAVAVEISSTAIVTLTSMEGLNHAKLTLNYIVVTIKMAGHCAM